MTTPVTARQLGCHTALELDPGAPGSSTRARLSVPVDEAEHKLQVLSDARSPAALQFLAYASAHSARTA